MLRCVSNFNSIVQNDELALQVTINTNKDSVEVTGEFLHNCQ